MTTRACIRCGELIPKSRKMLCQKCRNGPRTQGSLTLCELRVCALLAECKRNKDISAELGITVGTVKEYVHRIMVKTTSHSRTEVAIRFIQDTLER